MWYPGFHDYELKYYACHGTLLWPQAFPGSWFINGGWRNPAGTSSDGRGDSSEQVGWKLITQRQEKLSVNN